MIDMTFVSFLTLLVISLICAVIVHYGVRYRVLAGFDGFLAKWVVGWIGAWVGSPVLGHWFADAHISGVYIIPAFIGGFVGAFLTTAVWKAEAKVVGQHPA
jgi:uncharacterized membrane protein YeaQ/YmgE (transglycosylase-associated protein family)